MRRAAIVIIVCAVAVTAPSTLRAEQSCAPMQRPVPGPIVRLFAPIGAYGGHWGVDFASPYGSPAAVAASGTVTFAGSIGDMQSVTVSHGGGIRTSYSYLSAIAVRPGDFVGSGDTVGSSGRDRGVDALHFSARRGAKYFDPSRLLRCSGLDERSLALLPGVLP